MSGRAQESERRSTSSYTESKDAKDGQFKKKTGYKKSSTSQCVIKKTVSMFHDIVWLDMPRTCANT